MSKEPVIESWAVTLANTEHIDYDEAYELIKGLYPHHPDTEGDD